MEPVLVKPGSPWQNGLVESCNGKPLCFFAAEEKCKFFL
jgi:hypothetical protein